MSAAEIAGLLASCFWCERLHPAEHPLSVCLTYHDFGGSDGLDNEVHPTPRPGSSGDFLVHEQ